MPWRPFRAALKKLSISASVRKFFLRVSTALSGLIGAFTTTYIQMAAFGQYVSLQIGQNVKSAAAPRSSQSARQTCLWVSRQSRFESTASQHKLGLIAIDEQNGLLTRVAATGSVTLCPADEKLTACVELESAILGRFFLDKRTG